MITSMEEEAMLVLSRKQGESIDIGDNRVTVQVLGIKGTKVQLGVEAPPEVAIHRSEMAHRYATGEVASSPVFSLAASRSGPAGEIDAIEHSACDGSRRRGPKRRVRGRSGTQGEALDGLLGESLLDDLTRVQAEIAALAELVSPRDRLVARQVASEAADRLTAIERTLRFLRRDRSERPIAAYINRRSRKLSDQHTEGMTYALDVVPDEGHGDRGEFRGPAEGSRDAHGWCEGGDGSSTMARESEAHFQIASSRCSLA